MTNGEPPGSGNPRGNTTAIDNLIEGPGGSSDGGRAMAQIVHDVAPGAKILFASAFFARGECIRAVGPGDRCGRRGHHHRRRRRYFLSEPVFQTA
ncbi:MAG: hypothetical protein U0R27_01460 [Candidatus Nanopelagicales bacterium]